MANVPMIGIAGAAAGDLELHARIVERCGGSLVALSDGRRAAVALGDVSGLIVAGSGGGTRGAGQGLRRFLEAAIERDLPVLAVGDGLHAINLAFGGAPAKVMQGHGVELGESEEASSSFHRVYVAPGSKLAAIVGSGGFVRVNSRHDDGIREAQKSSRLLASAYGLEDGVIEALESPDHDWVIGVQFNPERRLEVPPHFDRLFQGLVERAGR